MSGNTNECGFHNPIGKKIKNRKSCYAASVFLNIALFFQSILLKKVMAKFLRRTKHYLIAAEVKQFSISLLAHLPKAMPLLFDAIIVWHISFCKNFRRKIVRWQNCRALAWNAIGRYLLNNSDCTLSTTKFSNPQSMTDRNSVKLRQGRQYGFCSRHELMAVIVTGFMLCFTPFTKY